MTLLVIIAFLIAIILIYHLIRKLIIMYTGCSQEDAAEIIQEKVKDLYYKCSNTVPYHIFTDSAFNTDAWNLYRSIFDDKRIGTLQKLSMINVTFDSGVESGICYLRYTVLSPTDQEKIMLETALKALLVKYLKAHNMPQLILVEWKNHPTLALPVLAIKYSESKKGAAILQSFIETDNQRTLQQYKEVLDEEDLYG